MKTIILNNDEEVTINPQINALTMKNLRDKEGFKTKLIIGAMIKQEDIDEFVLIDSVFLAYRQANPQGMEYETFLSKYDLDMEEAMPILVAVISKKGRQEFAKAFKKRTSKKK
ncbi:hypothetical protein [Enterococcus wangshanyuanii]|uniref:Phage protein n=1 Tax=Enterococcus wangshanyuanii TaxID=2005703 RepID=A0ABQ1NTN5_9ENTE|nr:hypothetical protein [Enterococcus wangshanyuanii]GGC84260.1 hypothetical protein GCM10011573_12330 [Enterococcus wangshanyuanii]